MQSYFIWNGIDCRSMGVRLRGPVPIVWPEERVEHIQIPGRSGDLTAVEGENIYNSYIQTATISVLGAYRCRQVKAWLRGSGYVTFSGEPDKRQLARVIGAVTLNRLSRNLDIWQGEVQFYCQPLKERLRAYTSSVSRGGSLRNNGDVAEYPLIHLVASAANVTLQVGGKSLVVTGAGNGTALEIDSASKTVTSGSTSLMAKTTGYWPVRAVGDTSFGGSGWNAATVERRERFL